MHYRCLRDERPSKPYEFIGFGVFHTRIRTVVTALFLSLSKKKKGFGAMDVTKSYESICFGYIPLLQTV